MDVNCSSLEMIGAYKNRNCQNKEMQKYEITKQRNTQRIKKVKVFKTDKKRRMLSARGEKCLEPAGMGSSY